jgi:hypothetical protein
LPGNSHSSIVANTKELLTGIIAVKRARTVPDRHECVVDGAAPPDTDAVINALAAGQHGVVARDQLRAAGLSQHTIEYRVKKGRLVLLYRGVYRVGPLRAPFEREVAALFACRFSLVGFRV